MEGIDGDLPLMVVYSKVTHSAYFLAVALCVCSHLLQEEASLMMDEQGTNLRI